MRKFSLETNDDGQGVFTEIIDGSSYKKWYFEFKERRELFMNMEGARLRNEPVDCVDNGFKATRCMCFEYTDSYFKAVDVETGKTYERTRDRSWAYDLCMAYETIYES